MTVTTISNTYSYFGNFSKLNNLKNELQGAFTDYVCQEGKENLPNGVQTNVYRFSKTNTAVVIRAYRIDFEFGFNGTESEEDFIKFASEAANKINQVLGVKGQRIAFSCVEFVNNDDDVVLNKANTLFNVKNVYGSDANELNIRVNHVKNIGTEAFNSVLIFQDGQVTNNQTKVQTKAMFINKDINTLVSNREERFTLKDTVKYLSDMMLESKERTNNLISKLGD